MCSVVLACVNFSVPLQAADIQTGRYSQQRPEPTPAQADLLSAMIKVQFPVHIQTVGAAIPYLLQRSGYRLADSEHTGNAMRKLMALPLPAVHRNLGPLSVRQALMSLAGPKFLLVEDPVHRRLAFELCTRTSDYPPDSAKDKEFEDERRDGIEA